jgi:RNA recognition motif-containing protein
MASSNPFKDYPSHHNIPNHYEKDEDKDDVDVSMLIEDMHAEFNKRRKITISCHGEHHFTGEEYIRSLLKDYDFTFYSKIKDNSFRLLFHSSEVVPKAMKELEASGLMASYSPSDSLLFVGNLPNWYSRENLHKLFVCHGSILRCFMVYSLLTGKGKGYGFVEYSTRDEAVAAKQKMATRMICGRSLRVDFADNSMATCQDLQSKTLFVDKLPKSLNDETVIREMFSQHGTVNHCQIALTPAGAPRGFAFVDMETWEGAEEAQRHCSGSIIDGHEIRVSFGMPCRPGACILQSSKPNNHNAWNNPSNIFISHDNYVICTSAPSTSHIFLPVISSHHLTSHNPLITSTSAVITVSSNNKENIPPSPPANGKSNEPSVKVGKKRHLPDDDSDDGAGVSVYDKPYIFQHDQGIPYTHPLKRMRIL